MRAVSTVLDVALFLLLVSAAIVALAVPSVAPPQATADETAETLAATTTNVTYEPEAGGHPPEWTQTATGTHAGLLARGAFANLRLANESLAPGTTSFRQALGERTTAALAWSPERTGVVAVWEPYPGAPLRGRFAVGGQPPPGVDVSTATLVVPAPTPSTRRAAVEASSDGFRGVAETVVSAVCSSTLGPDDHGVVDRQGSTRATRLEAYARALAVDPVGPRTSQRKTSVREEVERRLVRALASDMREQYDTPGDAATALRTGTVRIVVREWEQ